jgi:hypothetical protein
MKNSLSQKSKRTFRPFCYSAFLILLFSAIAPISAHCQEVIEWEEDIEITKESFKGPLPEMRQDNVQNYYFYTNYEFHVQMMNIQFSFTKNFNKYVTAYYKPALSWIEEGEFTDQLIKMANLQFDISELYARKLRKEFYESKKFNSGFHIFSLAHEKINSEFEAFDAKLRSELQTTNDWTNILKSYNEKVAAEIIELADFCKSCKPKKKKK